jgi:hypothetical protein
MPKLAEQRAVAKVKAGSGRCHWTMAKKMAPKNLATVLDALLKIVTVNPPFPLGLVFAISLSIAQALPPAASSAPPSPSPIPEASPSLLLPPTPPDDLTLKPGVPTTQLFPSKRPDPAPQPVPSIPARDDVLPTPSVPPTPLPTTSPILSTPTPTPSPSASPPDPAPSVTPPPLPTPTPIVPTPTPLPSASPSPSASVTHSPPPLPSPPPPPPIPPRPYPEQPIPMPSAQPPAPPALPPSSIQIQRMTPVVEVWRAGANEPQVPARRGRYLAAAYVGVNELVNVRLQFDPFAAGKAVFVRAGQGVTLESGSDVLRVDLTGKCMVSVRLGEGWPQGGVSFYSEGLTTIQPLVRTSASSVQTSEMQNARKAR